MKAVPKELRELDVWLAVNVFKYQWCVFDKGGGDEAFTLFPRFNRNHPGYGWSKARRGGSGSKTDTSLVPHYSTKAGCAFTVLAKIVERLGSTPGITLSGKVFVWSHPRKHEPYHDAPTLHQAICRFAKQLYADTRRIFGRRRFTGYDHGTDADTWCVVEHNRRTGIYTVLEEGATPRQKDL